MVLDPRNAAFPIPVERRVGGYSVRETQLVDYPYFIDVRGDGMATEEGITAGLDQLTLTWASPIDVDPEKNKKRRVIRLIESSDKAWLSDSLEIQPDFATYDPLGFPVGKERGRQLLAVAVEGRFESYFRDKPAPLAAEPDAPDPDAAAPDSEPQAKPPAVTRIVDHSPESARIVLLSSNTFVTDDLLNLAASGLGTRYLKPEQLIENTIDWALEERGLLAIRGRAQFSRMLDPLAQETRMFWEYLNYGLALAGLLLIAVIRARVNARTRRRHAELLAGTAPVVANRLENVR
jgi:ABC-2 type transport system permease protein